MPLPVMHPGRTLLGELLERNWTLQELAAKLGEEPTHIRDFLMEFADLTPELAKKIAMLIGTSEEFWMNMQSRYDAANQESPEIVDAK